MDADWDEVSCAHIVLAPEMIHSKDCKAWVGIKIDKAMASLARPHTLPASRPPCDSNAGLDNDFRHLAGASVDGQRICMIQYQQRLCSSDLCQGRVTSFYGNELQRYTSFKAHAAPDGAIRQILITDKGIVALGSRDLHMAMRRGVPLWHIRCAASPEGRGKDEGC